MKDLGRYVSMNGTKYKKNIFLSNLERCHFSCAAFRRLSREFKLLKPQKIGAIFFFKTMGKIAMSNLVGNVLQIAKNNRFRKLFKEKGKNHIYNYYYYILKLFYRIVLNFLNFFQLIFLFFIFSVY